MIPVEADVLPEPDPKECGNTVGCSSTASIYAAATFVLIMIG